MKLKKFNEYAAFYSKDPKNFEKKVCFACSEGTVPDVFTHVNDSADSKFTNTDVPVILWNNFNFQKSPLNESSTFLFNSKGLPQFDEVSSKLKGADFLPKSTNERSQVKGLKFPIFGVDGENKTEFKTYGKFKKGEQRFPTFTEKIVPQTKFNVIAFKGEPIHIQEKINKLGFDVDPTRFKYTNSVKNIIESLNAEYPLDFYHAELLESNGKLYLNSLDTSINLSPSQSIKMYEKAYEEYFASHLPGWFKKQIFESHVKPYYAKRYYDAALIKPNHSIDFKKYVD